jgi:hypothetical protein
MLIKPHLLDHARAAVERTGRSLAELQATVDSPSAGRFGRQHRLLIDVALLDLGRRHAALSSLYAAMSDAPEDQVSGCWQRFFECYDDYLAAARDARSRLVQNEEHAPGRAPRNGRRGATRDGS